MNELIDTSPEEELRALVSRLIAEPIEPISQKLEKLETTFANVRKLIEELKGEVSRRAIRSEKLLSELTNQLDVLPQMRDDVRALSTAVPTLQSRDTATAQAEDLAKTLARIGASLGAVEDVARLLATQRQAEELSGKLERLAEQFGRLAQMPGDISALQSTLAALHTREEAKALFEVLRTTLEGKVAALSAEVVSSRVELFRKIGDSEQAVRLHAASDAIVDESTQRLLRQVVWSRNIGLAALIALVGLGTYLAVVVPHIMR
jgi:DNA repair exonuclease SbcCD ATPase subunit